MTELIFYILLGSLGVLYFLPNLRFFLWIMIRILVARMRSRLLNMKKNLNNHLRRTGSVLKGSMSYVQTLEHQMRGTVVVSDKFVVSSYPVNGNWYKVLIPRELRGVGKVLLVVDQNDNDVTSEIQEYLGPYDNFHGYNPTPSDLGFEKLAFLLFDGSELSFGKDHKIQL